MKDKNRQNNKSSNVIIIFVDIRGFTRWSEGIEAFEHVEEFVGSFFESIKKEFESAFRKYLGDGALIVQNISRESTPKQYESALAAIFKKIQIIEEEFGILCRDYEHRQGYTTDLRLGWGITRGPVKALRDDFIGANVNKAARLCDIARPYGIVVDSIDFPTLPHPSPFRFVNQIRRLNSITGEVKVWVTDEIAASFMPRERLRQSPEVHVAGLCFRKNGSGLELLICKRNQNRRLFPGLYEGCGGQLAYSESFADGVRRHYLLEMHLEVQVEEEVYGLYQITQPNEPLIPGIKFLCRYVGGKAESDNHSEIQWVSEREFKAMPKSKFIPGVKEDFIDLLTLYRQSRRRK